MRVVMMGTRGVPAHYGGFETAVEEIGSRLAAAGHEVTVYCRRGNSGTGHDPDSHLGMRLVHLPCIHHRSVETLSHTALTAAHLATLGRRHDVALVFNAANAFALPVIRARGLPVAVHVDGLEWRRTKWGRFGRAFYRWSEARAVRDADALIADATGIQQYYREEFGATSDLLEYGAPLTAGTDLTRLAELDLTARRYHLLVARFEPENHVREMIEAYGRSGARLPLVVVGGTPYPTADTEDVHLAAARTPGVRLLGGVWDQELLDQLYAGASTYLHGHSVGGTNPSLLRAMGAGARTIAHDNVFNRDVLGDEGVFGATVDELAAAIAAADVDPDGSPAQRERLLQRCRERYDWDAVALGYAALCARLEEGVTQRGRYSGARRADSPWRRDAPLDGEGSDRPTHARPVGATTSLRPAALDDPARSTVTIVTPTYRRPEMLTQCLAAIRAQTHPYFEVLVCDNAADPAVGQIVDGLDDERFTWVPREHNLGILHNVWSGFAAARTELVMEVDDDDVLAPDALAQLVAPLAADPEAVVSFGDIEVVDGAGDPLPAHHPMTNLMTLRHVPPGRIQPFHDVAARGDVYMVSAVLRREAIDWEQCPDHAGTAYDRYLGVRLAGTHRAAHHVDRPVVAYRIHDEADGVRQFTAQLQGAVAVLEAELAKGVGPAYTRVLRDELTRTRILQVRSQLSERRPGEAALTAWSTVGAPGGARSASTFALSYLARAPRRALARRGAVPLQGRA